MPDHEKCIRPACHEIQPPDSLDPDSPLRESFAAQLRPEDRSLLEQLCGSILDLTREASVIAEGIPGGLVAGLAAVAVDIRFAARLLDYRGAAEGDALKRWEARTGDRARIIARRVAEVADDLEALLAEETEP